MKVEPLNNGNGSLKIFIVHFVPHRKLKCFRSASLILPRQWIWNEADLE